jgi:hypothetical protein
VNEMTTAVVLTGSVIQYKITKQGGVIFCAIFKITIKQENQG